MITIRQKFLKKYERKNVNQGLIQREHIVSQLQCDYICYQLDLMGSQKVQVGKDQEKAQSEKDSHSKNRGGKKTN